MGVHVSPGPEPSSHLPPHPIPQGHSSAPALSHASNLDWQSVPHMIIYMFQFFGIFFLVSFWINKVVLTIKKTNKQLRLLEAA